MYVYECVCVRMFLFLRIFMHFSTYKNWFIKKTNRTRITSYLLKIKENYPKLLFLIFRSCDAKMGTSSTDEYFVPL